MANTNNMSPKSFTNESIVGLILRPKWLRMMPINNIQVDPMEIPLNLKRPSSRPDAITRERIIMAPGVPP